MEKQQLQSEQKVLIVNNIITTPKQHKRSIIQDHQVMINEDNHENIIQQDKVQFIQELLQYLQCPETLEAFRKQNKNKNISRNPQEKSNRKVIKKHRKAEFGEDYFKDLINSNHLDQIISHIQEYMLEPKNQQDLESKPKINVEQIIQSFFPDKQSATIPIFKTLTIQHPNKGIKYLDINSNNEICLFDNENMLHYIPKQDKKNKLKLQLKREIASIKWITDELILIIFPNAKISIYNTKLQMVKSLKLQVNDLKRLDIHVLYHKAYDKRYIKIMKATQSGYLIVSQLIVKEKMIPKYVGQDTFETSHSFKALNIIKTTNKQSFKRTLEGEQKTFSVVSDYENYYGLADNSRFIIKFDSILKKQAIVWESKKKIQSMENSQCRYFLILLVSQKTQDKGSSLNILSQRYQLNEFEYNYECIRINGHGCVMQRTTLNINNPLIQDTLFYHNSIKIKRIFGMKPSWLFCFSHKNRIIYVSIKSGKVLYVQQMEEKQIRIDTVGSNNTIIYSSENQLKLLSINRQKSRKVVIELKSPRQRQTLMLRLSRHGIPDTLLHLLRQLRNNQIEIVQQDLQ